MATVTVTVYPTGHATVGGTWSNPGNIYTDNGRLTTISPPRLDTGQILNVTFPSAELPAEAEIASVSAQIEWRASRTANLGGGIQAGYDGALRGTEVMDSAPTANTDRVFTNTDAGVWTAAELNSGLAYAAVRAYRSIGILTTISFDYACLIVEYTMPASGNVYVNIGGTWKLGMAYVNVGGVWKQAVVSANMGGVWKS